MTTAVASPMLYDPWSKHHTHYSPAETSALLELLTTDYLIDSHVAKEDELLQDLLAVDLQFHKADVRDHHNVATAPELKEEKDIFLDLLATDMEVDAAKNLAARCPEMHYSSSSVLYDPYVAKERSFIQHYTGIYAADNDGANGSSPEELLRDNKILMELLAMDESVDDSKKLTKDLASDAYSIIEGLYEIDVEMSGAKNRVLNIQDLQCLLDVDNLVDGKTCGTGGGHAQATQNGKRSIFSVKEKYSAKVASQHR